MQRLITKLTLSLLPALMLPGCTGATTEDPSDAIVATPSPTPSATPMIVVKAFAADGSGKPKQVLDALLATNLSVEPTIWPRNGVGEPIAAIQSADSVDPAIDQTVCGKVKAVYQGAVIRKVGGIELETPHPTPTPPPDHKVIVTLPMPTATPSPTPTDGSPC